MSRNEVTGDEIKTKVTTKEYEEGYDRIFKKKPQSLDAAYERRAMMQGLIVSPLFDENKELIEDRTGLVTNPLFDENKELVEDEYSHLGTLVKEVEWPDSEERIDVIGQNGPTGEHYDK
jgi:hypothetical protein